MQIISGLKTLFGVVVYRLASSAFYALEPRWYTWPKVIVVTLLFFITFLVVNIFERCNVNMVFVTMIGTFSQLMRWFLCFIMAQFVELVRQDISLHWGLDTVDTALVIAIIFMLITPLFLPIALRFGLFWCDCGQLSCPLCQLCKTKWMRCYANADTGSQSSSDPQGYIGQEKSHNI